MVYGGQAENSQCETKKKTEKLEEVRRLWITVRQNNRLNVSERSGKRGKCDCSEISEISENTLELHTPQYTMLLKLGNTLSFIAYQSAHGRTQWCFSRLQIHQSHFWGYTYVCQENKQGQMYKAIPCNIAYNNKIHK